jgi:1,4-dihydroxy-2-naphthoyl-CoA synthase
VPLGHRHAHPDRHLAHPLDHEIPGGLRKLRIQKRRQRGLIHHDAHAPALFPPAGFAANLPWAVTKDKGETGVSETLLLREDQGAVTYLTMNSPGNLNALSDAMLAELTAAFRDLQQSTTSRVIVLRGEGKAFCAGHDLKEMTAKRHANDGGAVALRDLFDRCAAMMQMIRRLPQPVIAQAHGIATAAGCQLVASCDLAVAAEGRASASTA